MPNRDMDEYLKQLEELFHDLMKRIQAELFHTMLPNITPSQFLVLKKLSGGRVTVSELADFLGVSLSAVTSLVDRLNRAGLVERTRDELDRRLVWLEMTEIGKEKLKECSNKRREVMHSIMGQLEQEELRDLIAIYKKILNIVKNREKEGFS